ncbi:hypothetical protein M9458_034877, partial [Cirrhinus mrigala]
FCRYSSGRDESIHHSQNHSAALQPSPGRPKDCGSAKLSFSRASCANLQTDSRGQKVKH